jgi:methylmalonyl-CoA decarboxylase
VEDPIGTIIMQDARRRNALSHAFTRQLLEAFGWLEQRRVRAVVLRAAPGMQVWSAGHDVRELPETHRDPLGWSDPLRVLVRTIEEFPAPVIALIDGSVWGGACEVALACDLLLATPRSSFAITPARLGVPYNASGLLTFMNRIPLAVLKEMTFTAQPIDAQRAAEAGILNRIVAADQIEAETEALAHQIARNAPVCVAVIKEELRLLKSAHALTPDMFERLQGLRRIVYDSRDYQEGIHAFLEKRPPCFRGD